MINEQLTAKDTEGRCRVLNLYTFYVCQWENREEKQRPGTSLSFGL